MAYMNFSQNYYKARQFLFTLILILSQSTKISLQDFYYYIFLCQYYFNFNTFNTTAITAMILTQTLLKSQLSNSRNKIVIKQILDCYSDHNLLGKFRFENIQTFEFLHVILIHTKLQKQHAIEIYFPEKFPLQNIQITKAEFQTNANKLDEINNSLKHQNIQLKSILLQLHKLFLNQQTENFMNKSSFKNINQKNSSFKENSQQKKICSWNENPEQQLSYDKIQDQIQSQKDKEELQCFKNYQQGQKQGRKYSTMTGCADKELTQTKNLNRHFRSKLREVHRDLIRQREPPSDSKFIEQVFTPNRVGFEDIRKTLKNSWFNNGVKKQMSTGQFLHKILRGMMGIKSKKLMIKYYHVMVSAVQDPDTFIRWKYQ